MAQDHREPALLGDVFRQRLAESGNGTPSADHIVERLIRKFGDGDKPALRRALFARLSAEAELRGEDVLRIISECVLASESATYKDRYFCAAVTRRMREAGYLKGGGSTQW